MTIDLSRLSGLKTTVMGLGLHGGGVATARFLSEHGAIVTVTDLREKEELLESIVRLEDLSIRYVLGKHDDHDFTDTDMVIKNPAVPGTSEYLDLSRTRNIPIETDISLFLRFTINPVIAITGSKGKSTCATAVHRVLEKKYPRAALGGNITVSPLSFFDGLDPEAPIVLELSSWQLGDLRGKNLLKPKIALITNILPDHLDRYSGMPEYVRDKEVIFEAQEKDCYAVLHEDVVPLMSAKIRARKFIYSPRHIPAIEDGAFWDGSRAVIRHEGVEVEILDDSVRLPGEHNRLNLLASASVLFIYGVPPNMIKRELTEFSGIEHRLELFHEWRSIRFFNDSASTIPQAAAAAVRAMTTPVVVIMGGTDKKLDFSPLKEVMQVPLSIVLLGGSATEKIRRLAEEAGVTCSEPFDSLEGAVSQALEVVQPGASILFSPGCASFEMFQNEFDRGRRFKKAVLTLTGHSR